MSILIQRFAVLLLPLLFVSTTIAGKKRAQPAALDISSYDFREGDILLQHLASKLGSVIADVTNSQYSHCGMVVRRDNKICVIEAIGPVRIIPIQNWIKQGHKQRFTQLRPRDLKSGQIRRVLAEAEKMLGRPYDIQYEWDDKKIYCSELIYKAFDRALGIEVGHKQKLRELNWKVHPLFIIRIAGGSLPLDRIMVTPESLVHCKHLKLIASTFPPHKAEPKHSTRILAGHWQGEYTIQGTHTTGAWLQFDRQGRFRAGTIQVHPTLAIQIKSFEPDRFRKRRDFHARLLDDRGIRTIAHLQIRDQGLRIIGTWKDNLGNTGLLSFEKVRVQQ